VTQHAATARMTMPGQPDSVSRARSFVHEALTVADKADGADAAMLAVSELVTNAVLHAHSDIDLRVRINRAWPGAGGGCLLRPRRGPAQ